jgi:hypothetical protein
MSTTSTATRASDQIEQDKLKADAVKTEEEELEQKQNRQERRRSIRQRIEEEKLKLKKMAKARLNQNKEESTTAPEESTTTPTTTPPTTSTTLPQSDETNDKQDLHTATPISQAKNDNIITEQLGEEKMSEEKQEEKQQEWKQQEGKRGKKSRQNARLRALRAQKQQRQQQQPEEMEEKKEERIAENMEQQQEEQLEEPQFKQEEKTFFEEPSPTIFDEKLAFLKSSDITPIDGNLYSLQLPSGGKTYCAEFDGFGIHMTFRDDLFLIDGYIWVDRKDNRQDIFEIDAEEILRKLKIGIKEGKIEEHTLETLVEKGEEREIEEKEEWSGIAPEMPEKLDVHTFAPISRSSLDEEFTDDVDVKDSSQKFSEELLPQKKMEPNIRETDWQKARQEPEQKA